MRNYRVLRYGRIREMLGARRMNCKSLTTMTSHRLVQFQMNAARSDQLVRHSRTAFSTTASDSSSGLFSIQGLNQPSDFLRLASEAISRCNSLRATLASQSDIPITCTQQAAEALFLLDSISKHVCNVIDAAELCRCVHSEPKWRESASNAFAMLSDFIGQLNADTTLYESLRKVTSSVVFVDLSEEQQRFGTLLKAEFERDGIHLPDAERDHVRRLQNHITQLESLFTENITNSRKFFDVEASWVENIIPRHILEAHVPQSGAFGKMTLSTDPQIASTLGRYSSNPLLRREVHMESMTACAENLDVLEALRRVRHEASTAQGFASYADRVLSDRMAKNPATVATFLDNLQENVRHSYRRDLEIIAQAKRTVEGDNGPVQPWDIGFYTGALKARAGFDPTEMARYFTIPSCIEGMKLIVKELFGITMKEQVMSPDERWDNFIPADEQACKFVFESENGGELGTMYLDLYPRDGKFVHAAHFTVLCGCAETVDATEFQRPVVALVCNLAYGENDDGIVSHAEVETLFHEFGHALHSLLARTTFQHMAGTRAAMDFVETPSHLLEHYPSDPFFLKHMARHHMSGEVIPDTMIQLLRKSQHEFKSMELQNQILYARFDQALFGVPIDQTSTQIFAGLHHQLGIPFAHGTHWHSKFSHLVSYGAGYYGYLYAQAFASDIWQTHFQENSLSRVSGERLWHDLLGHGGARDPKAMLKTLLGRDPSVKGLFEEFEEL